MAADGIAVFAWLRNGRVQTRARDTSGGLSVIQDVSAPSAAD